MRKKKRSVYPKFIFIYIFVLIVIAVIFLLRVNTLLRNFEASQPERIVEEQIEILTRASLREELETVLPVSDELKIHLNSDKYPESFVKLLARGDLTYEQKVGSYGADKAVYSIKSGDKDLVTVNLKSSNTRTEMIVFTCADWELESISANTTGGSFAVPEYITVKVNGIPTEGKPDGNGYSEYSLGLLADSEIELTDIFGYTEKQGSTVRKNFADMSFTVPSDFDVAVDGIDDLSDITVSSPIPEFAYVAEYTEVPTLLQYNIYYIPRKDNSKPSITVKDNLGNPVEFPDSGKLDIRSQTTLENVPAELLGEAGVLEFAENWSLFMTNDLSGGLNTISKRLIKDSYLYNVAYKWATGVDRTFTSVHKLYDPPFKDERIYNFVQYSDNFFSCDVHLVKRMRIANGLDVDDELTRRLFFVKYDTSNDGKDNAKWFVADMIDIGEEPASASDGGDTNA